MRRLPVTLATFATLAVMGFSHTADAQGMLIPNDESVTPLALNSHTVEFEVTDNGAVTHVTQVFENHTHQDLEAVYYFAVPEGSVTTDFALWMNGERIAGEVLERDQARATYEAIVRRMRDPGLLEYIDGELFQASIYPVPAMGQQTVEIEFANVLEREGDLLHYRYPLHESASAEIPTFVVSGSIRSRNPIASLYSPYHEIEEIMGRDGYSATISMEESRAAVDQDFELYIGQAGDDVGFSLLSFEGDDGEDGYFMLTIAPSPELQGLEVLPKQVTLVVDTSGSMAGQKMEQAQEMLRHVVSNLEPDDTFQIIGFSSVVRPLFDEPMRASRENKRDALAFIDTLRARGNTNISGALERALQDPSATDRPHSIIFVTDGLPTVGDTDVSTIVDSARVGVSDGDRRIFSFGVGYDVNTRLLDGMARRGRGEAGYVRPDEDMSDIVGEFTDSIGAPLLTQLDINFGGVRVDQIYPNPLPDLYRDRDVTVFGRFEARHSSSVVIRGQASGREWVQEYGASFDQALDADTQFVANLWARRRIDELMTQIEETGETRQKVDEIVELGTHWGIVTPYTSYLAIDPNEVVAQPTQQMRGNREPNPVRGGTTGWAQLEDEDQSERSGSDNQLDMDGNVGGDVAESSGFSAGNRRLREGASQPSIDGLGSVGRPSPAAGAMVPMAESETGRDAVEASIARRENRNRLTVTAPGNTRRASGRAFGSVGGIWVEDGLSGRSADERIRYGTDDYFDLLSEDPDLRDILALGQRVRFIHRGRVIEVVP
ncbi:MAG: Ca-activated chloride channel family protein [Bradymonadia bacterium]|jgi:Ca-activated chloride channel family protein